MVAVILLCNGAARADDIATFYAGKQVRMIIGNPPGGDYDLGGRVLARYMGRYIPGAPVIVVQNMPGASTIIATNYLYNVAARDGTVFGSFSRNVPSQAVLGQENLKADPRKFGWIGGSSLPSRICAARASSPVRSAADLLKKELIVAGSGAGSSLSIVPTTLNRVLGMKFHVVEGYKGAADAIIALERDEVQGICHTFSLFRTTHAALLREGKIRILLHTEDTPLPDMPNVPSVYKSAETEEQRQMMRFIFSSVEFGRPYVAPPGIPGDRLAALRRAFKAAFEDHGLLAEAHKQKLDVTYRSPEELERLVGKLYATPRAVIAQAKEFMPSARD
jgi:tripartite-type tricarboxylate transporter receptor subunit TctC